MRGQSGPITVNESKTMFSIYLRLNLHVSATSREVIRATYGRLNPHARGRDYRELRHEILRDMLAHHASAQALYARAMS